MSNFDVARQATETATTSEGSALKEQETYLSSLEAKTQQFKASFQSLSNTILDSDLLKFFVDLGTTGVSAIDGLVNALGGLGTIGLLGGAGLGVKNVGMFKTWLTDLQKVQLSINSMSNIGSLKDWDLWNDGSLKDNVLKQYTESINGLSLKQAELALSTQGLTQTQKEQVLIEAGIIASNDKINASIVQRALAESTLTAEQQKDILTKLELINVETGEVITTNACTKAALEDALATKGVVGADADAIISSIGLTTANGAQSASFDLLTASIWTNIKALGKWLITNPIGWAILGGTAIFGLVKAYDALTDSVDEVKDRTDGLMKSFNSTISKANENAKSVESVASRYEELSKGVNDLGENVSLTTDEYAEYNDVVNQISEMFPTLISGYTDEGNAILSLKGNVNELRDAYKEAQTEAYNLLIVSGEDSDGNDIITNYQNQINGNESSWSKNSSYIDGEAGAKDAIDVITKLTGALTPDEFRKAYNDLYEEYKNVWYSDKIQDALKSSGFRDVESKWSEITEEDLANVKHSAQATIQTYNAEIDANLKNVETLANAYLMTNDDYSKLSDQSKTATSLIVNNLNEDIANGFKTKEDVGAYVAEIVSMIKDNPDMNDALVGLFTLDSESLNPTQMKEQVDVFINKIAEWMGEDPVELKVRLGFDNTDDLATKYEDAIGKFTGKAKDVDLSKFFEDNSINDQEEIDYWNSVTEGATTASEAIKKYEAAKNAASETSTLSFDEAWSSLKKFKDSDGKISDIQSSFADLANAGKLTVESFEGLEGSSDLMDKTGLSAEVLTSRINKLSSSADQLSSMQSGISSLSSTLSKKKEDPSSAIDASELNGVPDEIKNCTDEYNKYVEVLGNSKSTTEECQKATDNLATAYLNNNNFLANLNDSNKDYYISQLKSMGVANAEEVVMSELENKVASLAAEKEYASSTGKDLANSTYSEIAAFAQEKGYSDATTTALLQLALKKQLVNGTTLDFSGDLSNIQNYLEALGKASAALNVLQNQKNAQANGQAYSIPGSDREKLKKYAQNDVNSALNTKIDTKVKINQVGSGGSGGGGGGSKKDKSKTKIDWIARKLERLQKVIDATKSKFENLFDLKSKSSNLDSQIKQTTDLLKSNQKAADKYKKYADKVKLSKDLKKKVREGNYSIKNYSSKTADKINKYKEYYDNYKETKQQVDELTSAIRDLKEQQYQLYVDDAESNIDKLNAQKDIAVGYANQNSKLDAQKTYLKQSYDYQIKIADLTKDKVKKAQLQVEYQKQLRDLEKEKFENIQAYYDSQIKLLDLSQQKIEDRISLLETKGMTINAKYYEAEIAYQKAIMQQYNAEYSKLKGQLAAMEKAGMKGTDDWYDKVEALSEVESEITNCNTSIAEMNNKITEVGMSIQNKILSNIKSVSEEMEWATSLMSEMDMFKENSGAFTNEGLTTLGSYASGYNNSKYASKLSAGLVNEMNKALKTNKLEFTFNGQSFKYNSIEQLKDAITEANETWRDQITETYEYSNKIIDMMVDKLQSELSALQELIENKKNALTAEQDLYNYQKSIRESVDNAASLEKQIAALQGNNSEENMMKIQKLQDELSKAQDDLQEKEYDRYISDQQDMLDKLYSEYESLINAETKDRDALLQKGIQAVELSSQTISQTIGEYADKYNYTDVLGNIKTGLDIMTGNDSPLNSIKTSVLNAIAPTGTIPTAISGLNATLTNIAGSIAQKILKSSNPNAKSNTGDTSSPSTKENILSGGLKRKKVEDVFGNSKYYAKGKKKKASDYKTKINQVLFKKNKKVLTDAGLKQLRKIFNTTNDGIYQAMLDLSKAVGNIKNVGGFKTGGIARLIKGSGEDGLAMVRNGEGFIAPEHIKPIQDLVNLTPQLNDMLKPLISMPKISDIKTVNRDGNVSIDIGNIELHDVQDPKQFASQLVNVVQKDRNVQNMFKDLTDIPVNRNYNRLGINKYK